MSYHEENHPSLKDLDTSVCYLCGESLGDESTPDHIIPNSLFAKNSPSRPKLPVHHGCNNGKSRDDEWFLRMIQLMSGLNPDAQEGLMTLLDKADNQKKDAFIIGRSGQIRDYKLAVGLLSKNLWGWQTGQDSILNIGSENSKRTADYMKVLARGLYMRNVPGAAPALPELVGIQYAYSQLKDAEHYTNFKTGVDNLLPHRTFSQVWDGRVLYAGGHVVEGIDKGWLFIEFYGEVAYLASFR